MWKIEWGNFNGIEISVSHDYVEIYSRTKKYNKIIKKKKKCECLKRKPCIYECLRIPACVVVLTKKRVGKKKKKNGMKKRTRSENRRGCRGNYPSAKTGKQSRSGKFSRNYCGHYAGSRESAIVSRSDKKSGKFD